MRLSNLTLTIINMMFVLFCYSYVDNIKPLVQFFIQLKNKWCNNSVALQYLLFIKFSCLCQILGMNHFGFLLIKFLLEALTRIDKKSPL